MTADRELADAYGLIVDLKARIEAQDKMIASQDELNHNLVARIEELERAMSAIECFECGHDLLHCTCPGGLCFEEKP